MHIFTVYMYVRNVVAAKEHDTCDRAAAAARSPSPIRRLRLSPGCEVATEWSAMA